MSCLDRAGSPSVCLRETRKEGRMGRQLDVRLQQGSQERSLRLEPHLLALKDDVGVLWRERLRVVACAVAVLLGA